MQVYPASSPRSREGALLGEHVSFDYYNIARTEASSSSPRPVSSEPSNSLQTVRQGGHCLGAALLVCAPEQGPSQFGTPCLVLPERIVAVAIAVAFERRPLKTCQERRA